MQHRRRHQIIQGLIFTCLLIITACSNDNGKVHQPNSKISSNETDSLETVDTSKSADTSFDSVSQINYIDENGKKQGLWLDTLHETVFIKSHYLNDKLHGLRVKEFGIERHEQYYQNGIKHGLFKQFNTKDNSLTYTGMYHNDSLLWGVFNPDIELNIIPVKGFHTEYGSSQITLYYRSGEKMYSGIVVDSNAYNAIGEHKYFYKSGQLKSIINYDSLTIKKYGTSGNLDFSGTFAEWRSQPLQSKQ